MKKLLLLLTSSLALFALVAVPVACVHGEEDKDTGKTDKVLREFAGSVKYADAHADSASVRITDKANGAIELTLNTGLPLFQFCFSNVNIAMQGDSSVLRAQNQTVDAGNDAQFTLTLNGYLKGETLFLEVRGNELTAPLLFATTPKLFAQQPDNTCQPDGPSANYLEEFNCNWMGNASIDGALPVPLAFASTLSETGDFSIELDDCCLSPNMPPVAISLADMCFFAADKGFPDFTFSSNSAFYAFHGSKVSCPAVVDGTFSGDALTLKIELTLAGAKHIIDISNARICD